ncbi:o-succinylbenzoate synthase [Virgibacillus ihumii]|uniref:o-succinylbenzoate synthase n=1 Tax=Virgibacillus ihumii TaxID=2686091 RepID=UPI00157D0380|nr:o-succinylbenzoate synthase [Virgibacillus ihumii]
MTIPIEQIKLRRLKMQLKHPFTTSFGTMQNKEFFITEVLDNTGNQGFGESVAFSSPWYNEETVQTNYHVMKEFLIPLLRENDIHHPDDVLDVFSPIRRNNMAKSAMEGAIWDLYAKRRKVPLAEALGGKKEEIDVGISIGIQPTIDDLLNTVGKYVQEGFKRVKIKIKPNWDYDVLAAVKKEFPDVPVMADANSAYTLEDINQLQRLDELGLMMIEQPLAHDDIVDHSKLQAVMQTPICLDESIHSLEDTKKAIQLESCRIINIKIGRVGGLSEAKRIHDYCRAHGIPVWCGGMLEAGVGRAHNIALTSLSQFALPGDTAGSSRYWKKDIITPEVTVENGRITIPNKPGIGYEIDKDALNRFTVEEETFKM